MFPSSFHVLLLSSLLSAFLSRTTTALMTPTAIQDRSFSTSLHQRTLPSALFSSSVVVDDAPTRSIPTSPASTRPGHGHLDRQRTQRTTNYDQQLWEVKVYNDNINTHEWVARCLVMVVAQTEWQAYQTTKLAHQQGEACLGIWEQELAQRYVEGLSQQGIVVDMFPVNDFQ